jgi:hypothetical protein
MILGRKYNISSRLASNTDVTRPPSILNISKERGLFDKAVRR